MRILTTIHLNDIQKEVLAKTKAAPTPQVAFEEIAGKPERIDDNFASARDALVDLGLLTQGEGALEVTDEGLEVMKDENIVDDMGNFTEEGDELVGRERGKEPAVTQQGGEEGAGMTPGLPAEPQAGGTGFPMEGLELIREMQDRAKILALSTKR